ncbi:MAG: prolyl oligopeptidase family protein [Anaerolineales bacterium]
MTTFRYPRTHKVDQVDDYHGNQIADPYRWLEDPDSPETRDWIEAQNELTFGYLQNIAVRDQLRERLSELWDYPKEGAPVRHANRYFQLRNTGLQDQNVLYMMDSPEGEAHVLLDPNQLSDDGTIALTRWDVSPDGALLAYATSESGSDWMTWRVREVASGEDTSDVLLWSKFTEASWLNDSSGFYYSRYDEPAPADKTTAINQYHKLFFHRIGEPQDKDQLVYERPDQKEWGFAAEVTDDDDFLIIHVWQGTDSRNRVFYQELHSRAEIVQLIPDLEAEYIFLSNDGPLFYFQSDLDTPRGRVLAIDIQNPGSDNWMTIVPENQDALEHMMMVNDEFVGLYLHDAHHRIRRYDLDGSFLGDINLPTLGSVPSVANEFEMTGRRDHGELFFSFWSFLFPSTVNRYDFANGKLEQLSSPPLEFDTGGFVTKQVFISSKDGTELPLFLTHRRGLELDGTNPTLLYGYGGFRISMTPRFSISNLVWLEQGGVLAWAVLRGGGEYGEEWHKAGMLENKQNVFDDFIACAEQLVEGGFTSPEKLAIMGGSNGGLLVGACMNQRPDLFGAAVPIVGVMDMLRFHKFTIGWAWVSDYGSAEMAEEFETLRAYSPLHNLKPGTAYPATLIITADHDDRVVPAHSFKYAAALQVAQAGEAPTLIRIQTKAGHGLGKPTVMLIEEAADIWGFLHATLGISKDG